MKQALPLFCGVLLCGAATTPGHAGRYESERPTIFDKKIAELSRQHGVPERLIHRVIKRESNYRPDVVSRGNYGLMQIRYGTARSMGYQGPPNGLRDGETNMRYAVPYLANAYLAAGRDEDRAVRLYASGFYYSAKRQGILGSLRTAETGAPAEVAVASVAPGPVAALFGALSSPAQAAVDAAAAEGERNQQALAYAANAETGATSAEEAEMPTDAPLPPRRPRAYSTKQFLKLAMSR